METPPIKHVISKFITQINVNLLIHLNPINRCPPKKKIDEQKISSFTNETQQTKCSKKIDSLNWWFENKKRYPRLYILSLKYLCIPATSVASERVFSKGGEIVSAKRSCLKPKNVNQLIFLNKNHKKFIVNHITN